ncbi:MAG: nuclear transport factor 2 family protein [Burkholderiaceae bacterium]|nr:nuclear transport factor 2 family protein [Burkholderiaceae bacterium]
MSAETTPRSSDPRVARIVDAFETLTPADVPRLGEFYAADATFKDPFNAVRGVPAIQQVFAHMYVALDTPRFVIRDVIVQGDQCVLTWDFLFRFRRFRHEPQTVRGASHLKLDARGLITLHRDYWDVAEELYEKLPAVGALMRWLKRRANS